MSTPGNKGRGTQAVAKVAGDRAKLTFARVVVRRNLSSYSERGGSALVRRRIQTPSGAKVLSVVQPEGEVVLGASPPARRLRRRARGRIRPGGRAALPFMVGVASDASAARTKTAGLRP